MVLDKTEVKELYDRLAGRYDFLGLGFRVAGINRHRKKLIGELNLKRGDTVVDLCCGTGANLPWLCNAVGQTGRVVGVDLSSAMLDKARQKCRAKGWTNAEFVQQDVGNYKLPPQTSAVISTFGLEMVPEYDAVIQRIADQIEPDGRLGLLGLKHPQGWPEWLVEFGVWATSPFGVSRDYEDFRPWEAAERHLQKIDFTPLLFGAAYRSTCAARHGTADAATN